MFELFFNALIFAQNAQPPAGAANQPNPILVGIIYIVPIMVLFYFMLLRPNQKRERERKSMLSALKKNDHVVTVGGIKGVVANVKLEENEVVLKVDEATGAKLRVVLDSISRVIASEPDAAAKKDS